MLLRFKWVFRAVFVFAICLLVVVSYQLSVQKSVIATPQNAPVLIDAGHGGVDGGSSTADGVLEKTINLAISANLRDMLCFFGVPVTMVRDSDMSIHDEGCTTIRQKKVSDMANRLKLYETAALTVSIHQNHFSTAKYSGSQVFYAATHPHSRVLAASVQNRIKSHLQTDNARALKAATKDIYLLHHTTKPAILVECGFLSNPTESELLKTTTYQQQMALVIASGILDVYDEE